MCKQQKHETILSIKRLVKNQEVSNRPTSWPSGSSNAIGIGKYISDVDFLLSNHYFSCLQKSPRKPGAKIQLCPIRRWCAKNILLDSSSRWKTQKSTNWWSAILISSLSESRMVFNNPSSFKVDIRGVGLELYNWELSSRASINVHLLKSNTFWPNENQKSSLQCIVYSTSAK